MKLGLWLRSHSNWLLCLDLPGAILHGLLTKANRNPFRQTHCLGIVVLRAVSSIFKLSKEIKEATKSIS